MKTAEPEGPVMGKMKSIDQTVEVEDGGNGGEI